MTFRLTTPPALLAGALLALLACAGASAASPRAVAAQSLRTRVAAEMARAGGSSGAYVYDLDSGQALFGLNQGDARLPASNEKLFTTSTALLRFGPDATLDTTVTGAGHLDSGGRWHGDLYLRGGGDPTFGAASVRSLARQLRAHAGLRSVTGRLLGDESRFDTRRGVPSSGYALDLLNVGDLSALAFDHGATGGSAGPAGYAAAQLARALRSLGVHVGATGTGRAPSRGTVLALNRSPPMGTIVAETNAPSDNFFAEMLAKDLGSYFGGAGSTSAGASVVRAEMAQLGVHPAAHDGSGLYRGDRTTPEEVVALLRQMYGLIGTVPPSLPHPGYPQSGDPGRALLDSLAVAGRTGTLSRRMRGTAAQDRCHAKTGTLDSQPTVSALSGYCASRSGDEIAFSLLMGSVDLTAAHAAQDRIAAAIAAY